MPCTLIVILSWVGFWLNREATSDRITLGVTAVLTLSAISLDSRSDLPKVHYATALDWFIICSFLYCMASILEFAGVHYFTKIGSGEPFGNDSLELSDEDDAEKEEVDDDDDEDEDGDWEDEGGWLPSGGSVPGPIMPPSPPHISTTGRQCKHRTIAAHNNVYGLNGSRSESSESTPSALPPAKLCLSHNGSQRIPPPPPPRYTRVVKRQDRSLDSLKSGLQAAQTQTEKKLSLFGQFLYCLLANETYRKEREKAAMLTGRSFNSTSKIDSFARILFPLTFTLFNVIYWMHYFKAANMFTWENHGVAGNLER